jgi:hypothetical protein
VSVNWLSFWYYNGAEMHNSYEGYFSYFVNVSHLFLMRLRDNCMISLYVLSQTINDSGVLLGQMCSIYMCCKSQMKLWHEQMLLLLISKFMHWFFFNRWLQHIKKWPDLIINYLVILDCIWNRNIEYTD